jgi:UPF0755 protein
MDRRNRNGPGNGIALDYDEVRPGGQRGRISPRSAGEFLQPERVPGPPPRSRASRHPLVVLMNFLLTVAIIALVGTGAAALFAKIQFSRPGSLDQPRSVVIADGSSAATVADLLQRHGVISNGWVFRVGVRLAGQAHNLKAGEYLIPAHASMESIMDAMTSGKSILYSVTLPEGLTSQQIVDRLNADETLVGDVTDVPPEGSLLPDTYKFTRGDTRQNIINRMRRERDRVLTEVWNRRVEGLPIKSPEELVILASIVEKETAISDERSRVASVFINRLNRKMRLQSDPTALYGIFGGKGKPTDRPVTRADLDQLNQYNTYQIDGLPPGPIANPGRASLEAVANPSRTADLYFVADGTGGHAFAENYEEHRKNVARWRTIVAKRRQAESTATAATSATESAGPGVLDEPDDGSGDSKSDSATPASPATDAKAGDKPAAKPAANNNP